jgi:hypothetical protein
MGKSVLAQVPVTKIWRDKGHTGFCLYRYFDADDVLLYVGLTVTMDQRWEEHSETSTWVTLAARGHWEFMSDWTTAEAAEINAIRAEQPLFNREHNSSPAASCRLYDYLDTKGRLDLLPLRFTPKRYSSLNDTDRLQLAEKRRRGFYPERVAVKVGTATEVADTLVRWLPPDLLREVAASLAAYAAGTLSGECP